ncbi:hypothetical protein [Nonomuraea sp. NPDC049400]|uniref:hypothetical protein n=1 Tax=Nonomuraea sp. NPDC049400 TaxID=3364352 RepID=UPI00379EA812
MSLDEPRTERLHRAAARPLFRSACRMPGLNLQPAHPRTGTYKPHIERTLKSAAATLFAQYVSGYTGRSAEYRDRAVQDEPLWSLVQQELA